MEKVVGEAKISIQMIEEARAVAEKKYPSNLHPIYLHEPELLAQELEKRAKGYGKEFGDILMTAAHLIRLPPHD